MNDHHFTYGYYIQAAAAIAQLDDPASQWTSNYSGMVKLIAKDAANWDWYQGDKRFPFLRTFDPYTGQFWASGHCNFAAGCNQESSSEAMNLAQAMIQFGSAVGDSRMQSTGVFLYTHQAQTILLYVMDVENATVPSDYKNGTGQFAGIPHPHPGILWQDGAAYAAFFAGISGTPPAA